MSITFFAALPRVRVPRPLFIAGTAAAQSLAGWLGWDEQVEIGLTGERVIQDGERARRLGCDLPQIEEIIAFARQAMELGRTLSWGDDFRGDAAGMSLVMSDERIDEPTLQLSMWNGGDLLEALEIPTEDGSCGSMSANEFKRRCQTAIAGGRDARNLASRALAVADYALRHGAEVSWG